MSKSSFYAQCITSSSLQQKNKDERLVQSDPLHQIDIFRADTDEADLCICAVSN